MNDRCLAARSRVVAAAVLLVMLLSLRGAADGSRVLSDYSISSWTVRNGFAFDNVLSIAQDVNGYLWLGTNAGLVRFDGVRSAVWDSIGSEPLPRSAVRTVVAARDGTLWLGFVGFGGVARIQDRHVRLFGALDGFGPGAVNSISEDRGGTIWAGTDDGLYRLRGQEWLKVHETEGIPRAAVLSIGGSESHLLVTTSAGVYRRDDNGMWRRVLTHSDSILAAAEDSSGTIWTTDPLTGFRLQNRRRQERSDNEQGSGNRLLVDRRGQVWVGTRAQGVWRVQVGSDEDTLTIDRITMLTGLPGDWVNAILEDRQGNIWLGTTLGLTQLTPRRAKPIEVRLVRGLASTTDRRIWVATSSELLEISVGGHGDVASLTPARPIPAQGVRALHADRFGSLWAVTADQLLRLDNGMLRPEPASPSSSFSDISAITSDTAGNIWLYDLRRGLIRWYQGVGYPVELRTVFETSRLVTLYGDSKGGVWLAAEGGKIGVVQKDGRIRVLGIHHDSVQSKAPFFLEDSLRNIWIISDGSVSKIGDIGHTSLLGSRLPWRRAISAVVDDSDQIWVGTTTGILRIPLNEFEKAIHDPSLELRRWEFDQTDGLGGLPGWSANPNAIRTSDGRVWFVTGRGVTAIDPRVMTEGSWSNQVIIESITADGRQLPAASQLQIGPGSVRVLIDYTVLNFTAPMKPRFRYRLEGFEVNWIMAGTQRQATYTNLPPGRYVFTVQATNDDGSWNEPESTFAFFIQPFFFQRAWFSAFSIVSLALLAFWVWRGRVRQVRRHATLVMNERLRLSREIHDTLLQGLAGVALQFEVLARRADSSSKEQLERLRDFIEENLSDARRAIWNLRSSADAAFDLAAALRSIGERAAGDAQLNFELVVTGTPRRCDRNLEQQIFRIGQEAIANTVRHAQATHLGMELNYSVDRLTLRVSDDGRGFDLCASNGSARFGLKGMKERCELLGGTLEVHAKPGGGTVIEVSVDTTKKSSQV